MKKKTWKIIVRHLVLALLAVIWLIPIVWLVVTSLSTTKGVSYQHFFPEHWTLANYHQLFFKTDTAANFPAWFQKRRCHHRCRTIRRRHGQHRARRQRERTATMPGHKRGENE